jgi:hypothetical protein
MSTVVSDVPGYIRLGRQRVAARWVMSLETCYNRALQIVGLPRAKAGQG